MFSPHKKPAFIWWLWRVNSHSGYITMKVPSNTVKAFRSSYFKNHSRLWKCIKPFQNVFRDQRHMFYTLKGLLKSFKIRKKGNSMLSAKCQINIRYHPYLVKFSSRNKSCLWDMVSWDMMRYMFISVDQSKYGKLGGMERFWYPS